MSPPIPSPTSVEGGEGKERVGEQEEEKQVEKKGEKAAEREQNQFEKGPAFARFPFPSINHFIDLNVALSEFVRQWDGLLCFLDSVGASIDARFKELDALQISDGEKVAAAAVKEEAKSGQEKPSSDDRRAELYSICETMGSRFLRKFVTTHLSELDWLRREVPAALRRAPSPARLVFDSIGRFYLQGSRAYERNPTVIVGRRACILILEFYVLSGLPSEVESSVKQDAVVAALAWRSRLVAEGGIESATPVDALGLALFVASFGIPNDFGCDEMYDLLRSNLKRKADVFQQSPIFREKIPDIIKELLSKNMHVEAVHLACAFGLEEKFPPIPLLSSVLQKSLQTANEEQRVGQSLEVAHKKQLEVLKSVAKCVKDNKIDPSEIASFNLYQKIASLEKDIAKGKQKLTNKNFKRKAEEVGPLNQSETQAKRPWPAPAVPPVVTPHLTMQTQEQRSPTLSDNKGLYNGLNLQSMHDGGFTGSHYRSGMELLTGGVHGSAGVGGSLEPAPAADSAGLTLGNNVGSYTNIGGGSYGWHQDGALDGRSVAQGYSGFASSSGWMDPSAAAEQSLYQPQASPLGTETRRSVSNLYRFADIVLERESDYNSSKSNAMPSATNPNYYSSYLS